MAELTSEQKKAAHSVAHQLASAEGAPPQEKIKQTILDVMQKTLKNFLIWEY